MSKISDIALEEFGLFKSDPNADGCASVGGQDGWAFLDIGNDEVGIRCVAMEPGRRSKWHIHDNGAHVIACVAGKAWVQIDGQDAIALEAGQAASVPANTKHWHGAAKDSRAQIMVIHAHPEGLAHTVLEPVEDDVYEALS